MQYIRNGQSVKIAAAIMSQSPAASPPEDPYSTPFSKPRARDFPQEPEPQQQDPSEPATPLVKRTLFVESTPAPAIDEHVVMSPNVAVPDAVSVQDARSQELLDVWTRITDTQYRHLLPEHTMMLEYTSANGGRSVLRDSDYTLAAATLNFVTRQQTRHTRDPYTLTVSHLKNPSQSQCEFEVSKSIGLFSLAAALPRGLLNNFGQHPHCDESVDFQTHTVCDFSNVAVTNNPELLVAECATHVDTIPCAFALINGNVAKIHAVTTAQLVPSTKNDGKMLSPTEKLAEIVTQLSPHDTDTESLAQLNDGLNSLCDVLIASLFATRPVLSYPSVLVFEIFPRDHPNVKNMEVRTALISDTELELAWTSFMYKRHQNIDALQTFSTVYARHRELRSFDVAMWFEVTLLNDEDIDRLTDQMTLKSSFDKQAAELGRHINQIYRTNAVQACMALCEASRQPNYHFAMYADMYKNAYREYLQTNARSRKNLQTFIKEMCSVAWSDPSKPPCRAYHPIFGLLHIRKFVKTRTPNKPYAVYPANAIASLEQQHNSVVCTIYAMPPGSSAHLRSVEPDVPLTLDF